MQALRKTGLHPSDPRLKCSMEKLENAEQDSVGGEVMMDRDLFHKWESGACRYVSYGYGQIGNKVLFYLYFLTMLWTTLPYRSYPTQT